MQNHGLQMWLSVKYVYSMENCLDSILSIIKRKEKKLLDSKKKGIDSFPKLSLKSKSMLKIEVGWHFYSEMHEPLDKVKAKAGKPGSPTPPCHGHLNHSYLSKEKSLHKKKPSFGYHLEKRPHCMVKPDLGKTQSYLSEALCQLPQAERK